ncbi:methylmalonyl-CoA mutase family protein [Faunimonas sp. B44]|uniref:methylmalonyl-CoA mutase family protein n=1 Tax=Faunimonas sp. B44 TaxID=3461493 RepID=UPI004044DE07
MSETLALSAGAAPSDFAEWEALAAKSLRGASYETLRSATADGISIEPLYPAATGTEPLFARHGRPWAIVQPLDQTSAESACAQILRDREGGATGFSLRFADAPAAGGFGLPLASSALSQIAAALPGELRALRMEPHPHSDQVARWIRPFLAEDRDRTVWAEASLGLDPVGMLAAKGLQSFPADAALAAAIELRTCGFAGHAFEADGRVWHEAGASEAQELAAILGAAAHYLRLSEGDGQDIAAAFGAIGLTVAVDADQFLGIAKLRALRLLWARLQEACGAASAPCRIHAETSRRMVAAADPHTNLLRATIAAFAAGVGGADSVTVLPFTAALGLPERFARRLARNTQHLLVEEAHVGVAADPGAGSGAVEALTEALAERAWAEFQAIEAEGGIVSSLHAGAIRSRIAESAERLRRRLNAGTLPLVGVTCYPNPASMQAPVEDLDRLPSEAPATLDAVALLPVRLEAWAAEDMGS